MNQIIIIGNLTADPELRVTQAGQKVCTFTVAVNRRRREGVAQEADFFRVSVWENLGEICKQYLAKGRKVCVIGQVSVSAYKNSNGDALASMNVYAEKVEFVSPKQESQTSQPQSSERNVANAVKSDRGFVEVIDDDLPF